MTTIQIQQSDKLILVDDEDFNRINSFKWYDTGTTLIRTKTTPRGTVSTLIGNEVLQIDFPVDHKNLNYLDNQKENLRRCSRSQNLANRNKPVFSRPSASKYKGVTWHRNRWRVRLFRNKKEYLVGVFLDEEEAARAYDKKALEVYGEFAKLNFAI